MVATSNGRAVKGKVEGREERVRSGNERLVGRR